MKVIKIARVADGDWCDGAANIGLAVNQPEGFYGAFYNGNIESLEDIASVDSIAWYIVIAGLVVACGAFGSCEAFVPGQIAFRNSELPFLRRCTSMRCV